MKIHSISLFLQSSYIFTITLFGVSQLIGIAVALSAYTQTIEVPQVGGISGFTFIVAFFVATAILLLLLKYAKKPIVFIVIFYIAIIEGVWIFSSNLFSYPTSVLIFVAILFTLYWFRNVLLHDIVMMIAIGAIGAFFGLQIDPFSTIVVLILLAVYDYWAVYKTEHMVRLFKGMARQKVHFAYIIPIELRGLCTKLRHVTIGSQFFFLGTGDVALPLILTVSSLRISLNASLWVMFGSLLGYSFLYYMFIRNRGKKPMAGLPPIVAGSLIGFLIGYFL